MLANHTKYFVPKPLDVIDDRLRQKEMPLNRSPLFEDLLGVLRAASMTTRDIASRAGVSYLTLDKWLDNKTTHPRISTLIAVADVLDYDIKLSKRKAH